ncbi:MAG TPA: nuclear transport factor 2 family protein [Cyclobacteriaceae bacterium]
MKPSTLTQQEKPDVLSKKGACIEFFSAYQEMDIDRMLNLFSKDAQVYFEPLGADFSGPVQQIGKSVWTLLMDVFPDLDNTVQSLDWNASDHTVTCKVSIFGTQAKPIMDIPSRGLRFESEHIFIFRFNEEAAIDEVRVLWNHDRFVEQLRGTH